VADRGAAIDARGHSRGSIHIGEGTVFIAEGTADSNDSYATIHATGAGFEFTMNKPLYYDFVNKRVGGGPIFNLGGSPTSPVLWTSTNSDVAVWRRGAVPWHGNPTASFTLIDYQLRSNGSAWNSWAFVPGGDPDFLDFWNQGAGTAAAPGFQMMSYTRISANNAPPILTSTVQPATNADKYIRWTGVVPEGLKPEPRAFWDHEVYATVEVTKKDGTKFIVYASALTDEEGKPIMADASFYEETLYEVQTGQTTLSGVLRIDKFLTETMNPNLTPGDYASIDEFLEPGDSYKILEYWRGNPDPNSPKRHVGIDMTYAGPITITNDADHDVVPPLPAMIESVPFYANSRALFGTWEKAPNDNPPVLLEAMLVRGSAAPVALPGAGSINSDFTWTFDIDAS